jgi:hypothetical protein
MTLKSFIVDYFLFLNNSIFSFNRIKPMIFNRENANDKLVSKSNFTKYFYYIFHNRKWKKNQSNSVTGLFVAKVRSHVSFSHTQELTGRT